MLCLLGPPASLCQAGTPLRLAGRLPLPLSRLGRPEALKVVSTQTALCS